MRTPLLLAPFLSFILACGDKEEAGSGDEGGGGGTDSGQTGECDKSVDFDCDGAADDDDCAPDDPYTYPGATEIPYDEKDNDCAGDGDLVDVDGDGFIGESAGGDDCNDGNPEIHPGSAEVCYDGIDQDCDGLPVDNDSETNDCDGDGHEGRGTSATDCDDEDPAVNPDAAEIWYDGIDQDCDVSSDFDQDGDGEDSDDYGGLDCDDVDAETLSTALERLDGVDRNCDGLIDELTTYDAVSSWFGNAASSDGLFGFAFAPLDDYDGDGLVEVGVGGPLSGSDSSCDSDSTACGGWVSVMSVGVEDGIPAEVALSHVEGRRAVLSTAGDWLGFDLANLGDLDGDGWSELAVGAPTGTDDAHPGAIYLFSGADLAAGDVAHTDALTTVTGEDYLGLDVGRMGDLDGDGLSELVGGATDPVYGSASGLQQWLGVWDGATLDAGGELSEADALARLSAGAIGGTSLGGQDWDGDGAPDLIVSANTGGNGYLLLVPSTDLSGGAELSAADYPQVGGGTDAELGARLSDQGDLDGDGYPELAVGAPGVTTDDEGGGEVYVLPASALSAEGTAADLATFTVRGVLPFGRLTVTGDRGGDVDGDGLSELLVSHVGGSSSAVVRGTSYLFFGPTVAAGGTVEADSGEASFPTRTDDDQYGFAGLFWDVDGDGDDDLTIGAPYYQNVGSALAFRSDFP